MYVTRTLSDYRTNRKAPEGRNSGVLIIQDKESKPTCCLGFCYAPGLKGLPFPQNVKLTVKYNITVNSVTTTYRDPVAFIPVLDLMLRSNCYYAIKRSGKHSGESSANATEEDRDRVPFCFCHRHVPEVEPQHSDTYDIYQKFEIYPPKSLSRSYFATSAGIGWVPPELLEKKYWTVEYSTSDDNGLRDDARGLYRHRSKFPTILNTNVLVGKWYVPFIFVNESNANDHLKATYYPMSLYQRWEEVYCCENAYKDNREVVVTVQVEPLVVKLEGHETVEDKRGSSDIENMVVWFEVANKRLGLKIAVIERMKMEELNFGWGSDPQETMIERSSRFNGGDSNWKSYRLRPLTARCSTRARRSSSAGYPNGLDVPTDQMSQRTRRPNGPDVPKDQISLRTKCPCRLDAPTGQMSLRTRCPCGPDAPTGRSPQRARCPCGP
ncbi:hypothetical protein F2Q70_00041745 [Brassica cretica]|uniref:Uncharacterized protein n=1 Tax=Brassica cretica TaxID=69181 RepID=A0A8S9K5J9_BRACR|nr:hypothetical protein F2Q70_00041745 [Brassica cretica]